MEQKIDDSTLLNYEEFMKMLSFKIKRNVRKSKTKKNIKQRKLKEKQDNYDNQENFKKLRAKLGYEYIIKVAMVMKNVFNRKNVRSIFLQQLVNRIKKSIKQSFLVSKEEIQACILDLSELIPDWVYFSDNYQGTLVRLKSKKKMGVIVGCVKREFGKYK